MRPDSAETVMTQTNVAGSDLSARTSRGVKWVLVGLLMLLCFNWIAAVARFQVNGLFFDQWSFYTPLFEDADWWTIFSWQHGPHRQGLGFLLTAWFVDAIAWDSRVESLWIVFWLVVAVGLMLRLRHRLLGRIQLSDMWIPVAMLGLLQYESVILVPNLSHSVMPLVLVMAVANLWPEQWSFTRALGIGSLGGVMWFTGFGLFGAMALAVGFWWVATRQEDRPTKWAAAAGLGLLAAGLVGFGVDYRFSAASDGFGLVHWPLSDYPEFVASMFAARLGWQTASGLALATGGVVAVALLGAMIWAAWSARKRPADRRAMVAFLLTVMGWLYIGFTMFGRVHLEPEAATASRYMTLVLLVWLGASFLPWGRWENVGCWAILIMGWLAALGPLVHMLERPEKDWLGTVGMRNGDLINLRSFEARKLAWIAVWQETGDWRAAETAVPDGVFPHTETMDMDERLAMMRERGLSFAAYPADSLDWLSWWRDQSVYWASPFRGGNWRSAEEGARAILRVRYGETIGLQGRSGGDDASSIVLNLNGRSAPVDMAELEEGLSIFPLSGDQRLRVQGSANLRTPVIDHGHAFPSWQWTESAWVRNHRLVIKDGFYGWENSGEFGWTAEKLTGELELNFLASMNVWIESQFDPVSGGNVVIEIGSWTREFVMPEAGDLKVSLLVGSTDEPIQFSLRNTAGAVSPREVGLWDDARPLGLRLRRLTVGHHPEFEVGNLDDIIQP